jgi:hypothetical protein
LLIGCDHRRALLGHIDQAERGGTNEEIVEEVIDDFPHSRLQELLVGLLHLFANSSTRGETVRHTGCQEHLREGR